MGWSLGGPDSRGRFVGYGVPAYCDHPQCRRVINRGLSYVCGGEPFGGDIGCGLYFCARHLSYARDGEDLRQLCERCVTRHENDAARVYPFKPKPEHRRWLVHLLVHSSWCEWRAENPKKVTSIRRSLAQRRRWAV